MNVGTLGAHSSFLGWPWLRPKPRLLFSGLTHSLSGVAGQQAVWGVEPGRGVEPGLTALRPPEPAPLRAALLQQCGARAQLRGLLRSAGEPAPVRNE